MNHGGLPLFPPLRPSDQAACGVMSRCRLPGVPRKCEMAKSQQHAWSFCLSENRHRVSIKSSARPMESTNHAIPIRRELLESLGWLIENGLIHKADKMD